MSFGLDLQPNINLICRKENFFALDNEIGAVLKEFNLLRNPTILGNPTCPDLRPHASTEDIHAQPKSKGIIPSAIIMGLKHDLNSKEISYPTRDNQ